MNFITVEKENPIRIKIHYKDRGRTQPVVFSHGLALMLGKTRWCFWHITDSAASPMTVVALGY